MESDKQNDEQRKRDEEYANTLRALIRHDNEVSNQRTVWLMTSQTILVTAASLLLKDYPEITIAVAIVGALITSSIGHSLRNSFDSRKWFKKRWQERIELRKYDIKDVLPLDGGYPDNKAIPWLLPGNFIPKVILTAWLALIFYILFCRLNLCCS